MNDKLTHYSESDFQYRLQANIMDLSLNRSPSARPTAFLLGGQSGAGKSTLHQLIRHQLNDNVIVVDGDTFRTQHPNSFLLDKAYGKESVNYKSGFSGKMVQELYDKFSDEHYHLMIEGTLRTTETPLKTALDLKRKGYRVNLAVMAVSRYLSYLATLERYEKTFLIDPSIARATTKVIHDQIVDVLPSNLDYLYQAKLFDNISLIKRDGTVIYDFQQTPAISPKEILAEELSAKPMGEIRIRAERILALMETNGHDDSDDYFSLKSEFRSIKGN